MTTERLSPSACGMQLSKLWSLAGGGFPVDVKALAFEVSSKKPDPITKIAGHSVEGIEGTLIHRAKNNCWYILYQENIGVDGRINFTLAHELGHYMLHRKQQTEFKCDQHKLLTFSDEASKRQEAEANKFASFLLMPIDDFRNQVGSNAGTLDLLGHCANRYNVSFTATAIKWLEFTTEAAMVVVARDGFICWSYPSQSARKHKIYFPPGTPLPGEHHRETVASYVNDKYGIPAGVWHPKFEAVESVIRSDRFDLAIYLVQFSEANLIDHEDEVEGDAFDFLTARAEGLLWKK